MRLYNKYEAQRSRISIHAPTWGATFVDLNECLANGISIHAPTWGATAEPNLAATEPEFQSTHPRGVRRTVVLGINSSVNFNPRTHVGCDLVMCVSPVQLTRISIHAPTWGATKLTDNTLIYTSISIHAPTWGATQRHKQSGHYRTISIHAPTWGATWQMP